MVALAGQAVDALKLLINSLSRKRIASSPAGCHGREVISPAAAYEDDLVPEQLQAVERFIADHWDDTVRFCPEDEGTLTGLPHPYTIPSRQETFQELYYWDTYFTCRGLVGSGRTELAVDNARNLLAQVERHGFVPNGNRTYYSKRSQIPFLAPLVALVAEFAGPNFAREAVPVVEREYAFWTLRRISPTGLSRYSHDATPEELLEFFPTIKYRLGWSDRRGEDCLEETSQAMAECESGWDFNFRFAHRAKDFCAVDLNSNLYLYETLLADWTGLEIWRVRAQRRRELVSSLCWDEVQGMFFDYDFVKQRRGTVASLAAFQPMWTGLASTEQAERLVENLLPRLEFPFGLVASDPGPEGKVRQWSYPNIWPCLQYVTYRGMERYGYLAEARRVAGKYLACVSRNFAATGDLWEKYHAVDGSTHATGEAGYLINPETVEVYNLGAPEEKAPAMMGWTAGVFIDALRFMETTR
ncbi:hypothetical protein BH09VER1_BH09VER1_19270 [soil metagenome]